MDYPNNKTESRKNKYLNFKERMTIEIKLKDCFSIYKIAKELGQSINTIINKINRGTDTQIRKEKNIKIYVADSGKAIANGRFEPYKIVCAKTFYNYINLGLLNIKNTNLPIRLIEI